MDNLTYVCQEADAHPMRFEIPLITVKATAFSAEVPTLLSSHRKLLCMNMKQSNRLRVLNRQGKYAETDVRAPVLRHLVSSEGLLDHCAFFAAGGEELARLKPLTQASGELSIMTNSVTLREELYGVAVGPGDIAYALGTSHVFEVDMETSTRRAEMELPSKTVVKYPTIAYHQEAQLLLTPARRNCLDLVSASTRRSVLSKVWEPHSGEVPTTAFFVQCHKFVNEAAEHVYIVTAARGNKELRLWCYNKSTHTFSLKQELNISLEKSNDADDQASVSTAEDEDRDGLIVSCTPNEEYITLAAKRRPLVVVLEVHRSSFKVNRITSWRLQGPALCTAATVGKIADSIGSASVDYQLVIAVRTASGFYEEVLDVEKLAGASNTANMKQGSVLQWFPQSEVGGDGGAALLPSALTAVSSSVLGEKTTNAVSQAAAAKVVRVQAVQFCETLRGIDERVVDLQKGASEVMRLFQEARARDEAQTIGRKFATRNKGRLEQQQRSEAPEQLSAAQQDLLRRIQTIVEAVEPNTAETAAEALKSLLSRRLKDAVEKGAKEAEQVDIGQSNFSVRSTDSARVFNNKVDAALRGFVRTVKDQHTLMTNAVNASNTASAKSARVAKEFTQTLKKEMQELERELQQTKEAVSQANVVAAAPFDPDVLVARAVVLAESGEWPAAFTTVLEAGDIAALLTFLGNKVCEENMATITNPNTLPLPTFLSLCLQLSFELVNQPGTIPLRVRLLQVLYVEWDDTLKEMKQKAAKDSRQKTLFEVTKQELLSVAEELGNIEDHSVDRKSRNHLRLLKRLLVSILVE